MNEQNFYQSIESAVEEASRITKPAISRYETDCVSLVWAGYDKENKLLFNVYRTHNEHSKQCYIIRFPIEL